MGINFNVTREDAALINTIVKRAYAEDLVMNGDTMSLDMDLTCVHANEPLDLQRLLDADGFNFGHDVVGIQRHLNRETGELENFFCPRFTKRVAA